MGRKGAPIKMKRSSSKFIFIFLDPKGIVSPNPMCIFVFRDMKDSKS